ncbi:MAG: phosphoenolpyruvate--protein phosphotransferase [Ktedonobacteraceae bacterium]
MTVGLVIVSHSTQLAAGVAELASQMIQHKVPIAAAGGATGDSGDILGTSVDKILAAIQSVDGPDGVLVLMDLGSAILSTEMALELLDSEQAERIQLSYAPLVEGAMAAAIEASIGHTLMEIKQAAEKTASREQLRLLKPLQSLQEETPFDPTGHPFEQPAALFHALEVQLTVTNPTGLHARPATLFVQTAAQFHSRIEASGRERQTEATNIIGVLSLGLRQGDTLTLRANGVEAEAALEALSNLVQADFYETAPAKSASLLPKSSQAEQSEKVELSIPQAAQEVAQETWQAVATSPGVAIGSALLYTSDNLTLSTVEQRSISAVQVASEQERLRRGLADTTQELHALARSLQSRIGQADAAIFTAQALMLQDTVLLDAALHQIAEQHVDAASALVTVSEQQASTLQNLDNPLLAARAIDLRDAISRVLRRLSAQIAPRRDLSALTQPVILLAQDLTPSDTALLRPETVLGICTTQGGPTAHSSIIARALGIPAIAGLPETTLLKIHADDQLGLDADNGLLYHFPSSETRAQLQQRLVLQQQQQTERKTTAQQAQHPVDINGRHISLLANIGSEAEAEAAQQWRAEGIGLLRTEFLFANASSFPAEDEQRHHYIRIFQAFRDDTAPHQKPIVVRTLDAGADKPMPALERMLGATTEANPALGLRGIRISLAHQFLLEQQLTALLLAAAETEINLHIMFPMITTVEELRSARAIFDKVYEKLKQRKITLPPHVPVGIMVEVPAAVVMIAELAELADFFSIGANDLLQYTLACDRTNATVSHLYQFMQPAVLRLIAQVADAGRHAHKPVAICGEIASDVRLAPLLVGLGIDELSMTPTAIPTIRATLIHRSSQELTELAQSVLSMKTVAEVEQVCDDFFNAESDEVK